MLTIACAILLVGLVLALLLVVLLLGATVIVFGLLLVAATLVAWGLWASWAITGADLQQLVMPAAIALGVLGILAVRRRDRLERR